MILEKRFYFIDIHIYMYIYDSYNINVMCIIGAFDRVNYSTLNLILHLLSAIDLHHDFSRIVLESLFPYRIKNDKRLSLEPRCSKRCEAFACLCRRTLSLSFLRSETAIDFEQKVREFVSAYAKGTRVLTPLLAQHSLGVCAIQPAFATCGGWQRHTHGAVPRSKVSNYALTV